jgi:predicted metal-dependent hydrolase
MTMAKATPSDVHIAGRDIRFDLAGVTEKHWLAGDPVGTAVFNTMSLMFPDGERLFIDAIRQHRDGITGKLAEDVRGFIAQESIHAREHHGLNQLVQADAQTVSEILAVMREDAARTREAGPMAMMLATISLEHFTAMMAEIFIANQDQFARTTPEIERMWRWHALEEMEHKGVAFDVYMHASQDWTPFQRYTRRIIAMTIIARQFTASIIRHATTLLESEGYSHAAALKAVRAYVWRKPGLFRRGWRTFLGWYRPGFHPWDQKAPAATAGWRAEFDALARPAASSVA